jgi:hypothetical protein
MVRMTHLRRLAAFVVLFALCAVAGDKSASLQFLILKDADGKPVRNAEIVLHPVDKKGHQKDEGIELKTHDDGKAQISGIPFGKLRVQVICPGFQTFGQDYSVADAKFEVTIKLKKPADQYTIYK